MRLGCIGTSCRPNPSVSALPYTQTCRLTAGTTLSINDSSGRLVRQLVDSVIGAGPHVAVWDGSSGDGAPLESGVYFRRLESVSVRFTVKMVQAGR